MATKTSAKTRTTRRNATKSTKKAAPRVAKRPAQAGKSKNAGGEEVTIDRRRSNRREEVAEAPENESSSPQLERRKKVNRRRQIDPTTCERDYTDQEVEFMNALDEYKRKSGRMFPTCSEVLEVLRSIGYVKLSTNEAGISMIDASLSASAKPMIVQDGNADSVESFEVQSL